ncbi:MAG TPA: PA2169 family four-helix-bundle protein [Candidatus Saccharimonadia bacterium]|nr:PA2169 family four-helix-bundle protein [Candidatus Saccharimonadia bacterium]
MNNDIAALSDMIRALNEGRAFYVDAATKATREDLKRLFDRMAKTKTTIINNLQNKVIFSGHEPVDEGKAGGAMRQAWSNIRARLSSDKEASYVTKLEDVEARILASFRDAIAATKDESVRVIAQKYMPQITSDHDEIRALNQVASTDPSQH